MAVTLSAGATSMLKVSVMIFARSSFLFRDALTGLEEAGPGIVLREGQGVAQIVDREMGGAQAVGELVPGKRRGDRGARQGPRRIGSDRGRAALVAQIVDEDAPAPRPLRHDRDEAVGPLLGHRL